ncbi:MAG: polyprenyl synthetase family protein [Deltaproteobacteria bacterium]|nr:polyprenyl synthetase family protein [Deltaproteobacteria bacterium]
MTDSALNLTPAPQPAVEVLGVLRDLTAGEGLTGLSAALAQLRAYVGEDLERVEHELEHVPRAQDVVGRSLHHLLTLDGKRLRPLCVALAARIGRGGGPAVVRLATAVELVHSATLLHDDVVDDGTLRRGRPTARVLYGNAASVFAGDWLLIEALRRVQGAGVPGVMEALLATIDEMIRAEALQLECRGRLVLDEDVYFRVVEGKTAALFRWAMQAGAAAGGLAPEAQEALMAYGMDLGVAFQIIDDALDLAGDAEATGKALFTDLFEGKMTYPLLVGAEADPALRGLVEDAMASEAGVDAKVATKVVAALRRTGALEATRKKAEAHARRAGEHLEAVPDGVARRALTLVAQAAVHRSK